MEIDNEIEVNLNREVDDVIQNIVAPQIERERVDQRVLARTLIRLASDIQQVIQLIVPLSSMTSNEQEEQQPPNIINAAKTLLVVQIDKLKELAEKIE